MYRIGFSSDIHRLIKGDYLILGGIKVPCEFSVVAHSDGDVLLHAISESILGALSLGDLGDHFPDSDPKYKNIESSYFINYVNNKLKESGYSIVNLDCSLTLEKPKLKELKNKIKSNIAKLLNIPENCVNIKAGTNEGVDALGESKAIKAESIVLIMKN